MTDVRARGIPPPSPHWKGPLAAADRPAVAPAYRATRLRPEARSLTVPGRFAMLLLSIQIIGVLVVAVAFVVNRGYWSEAHELSLQYSSSQTVFETMHHRYSSLFGFAAVVGILLAINGFLFFVTFVWWFQRAYRNLAKRELHPAWAYVGWFVPVMNLWRPKQIANRIWRGSLGWELGGCVQWWWFGPYALLLASPLSWLALFFAGANSNYEMIGILAGALVALEATVPMALFRMIRVVTRVQEPLIAAAREQAVDVDAPGPRVAALSPPG